MKIFTLENLLPKKPYLSPMHVQLGAALLHPGRGTHVPGFPPPNKPFEWVLGEDLL